MKKLGNKYYIKVQRTADKKAIPQRTKWPLKNCKKTIKHPEKRTRIWMSKPVWQNVFFCNWWGMFWLCVVGRRGKWWFLKNCYNCGPSEGICLKGTWNEWLTDGGKVARKCFDNLAWWSLRHFIMQVIQRDLTLLCGHSDSKKYQTPGDL